MHQILHLFNTFYQFKEFSNPKPKVSFLHCHQQGVENKLQQLWNNRSFTFWTIWLIFTRFFPNMNLLKHCQISNIIHAFSENVQESLFFIVFHHFQCPFLLRNSFISYILGVYSAAGHFLGQEGMGVSFSKGKNKTAR